MDSQSYMASAEHSFKSNNLQQAINNANMAKNLNPQSHTIINSIAAYKIHLAAKKQGGEIDWYDVLEIKETNADLETIKKYYRKLALMVHPDKNKSAAAEGAFKLIGEAWEILSNPSSREAYDLKRKTTAANYEGQEWEELKECPYCGKWCKIEKKKRRFLQIFCLSCKRKFIFRRSSAVAPTLSGWWSSIMRPCRAPPNGYGYHYDPIR